MNHLHWYDEKHITWTTMEKKHTLHKCMMYSEGEADQKKKKREHRAQFIYTQNVNGLTMS